METHKTCCFIGHRKIDVTEELKSEIKELIIKLIDMGVTNFLFGSRSQFDELCHEIVTEIKKEYPFIKRISYTCKSEKCVIESEREYLEKIYSATLKKPVKLMGFEEEFEHSTKYSAGKSSYIQRNFAMINNSNYCVFYYNENSQAQCTQNFKYSVRNHQSHSGTQLAHKYAHQKKKIIYNLLKNN